MHLFVAFVLLFYIFAIDRSLCIAGPNCGALGMVSLYLVFRLIASIIRIQFPSFIWPGWVANTLDCINCVLAVKCTN